MPPATTARLTSWVHPSSGPISWILWDHRWGVRLSTSVHLPVGLQEDCKRLLSSSKEDTMRSPKAWTAAIVTAVALCFTTPVSAEMPNDQQALAGLSEVKVAFDLTTGDPKQLLTQLTVIDETRESVMSQGAK